MKLRSLTVLILYAWFFCSPSVASGFPLDEPLAEETQIQTVAGNPFTAPAGWTVSVRGAATIVSAPESGSQIILADVQADNAESAVAAAWAAYKENVWALRTTNNAPDSNGWTKQTRFSYQTSPNEKRRVSASAFFANDTWTVAIYDVANDVGGKRGAQISLIFSTLLPKGYERESFAGKKARPLGKKEIAELSAFIERGLEETGVPGTSVGIVQDGKVVFSGGFGVRELGKPEKVDGDTLYMIASNTKGLSTLLLARLVDEGKISWQDKVVDVLPGFKLGDAETTDQVLIEHLVCACTGLPRQDMEWILEFANDTPESSMALLGTMQPTSGFGEMFQYSNHLAAAGGYVAGYVVHPESTLGDAYDMAMQSEIFDPLGMSSTTLDFERALGTPNHASAHGANVQGKQAIAPMEINYSSIPVRPAAAAWSNVNDMLKMVKMELADGKLPNGERFIGKEALFERRAPKVLMSEDNYYGMGLILDAYYGVPVVHHGGDMIGFHSDMMWLPDQGVGAVVLTNGDPGWLIRSGFKRKLLEVLFDGKPEADEQLASNSKVFFDGKATEYKLLDVPAASEVASKLARHYRNDALGDIIVRRDNGVTTFDLGEWASEVASRENPDGTVSYILIAPGAPGFEFLVGTGEEPTLVARDSQHEYVFVALDENGEK